MADISTADLAELDARVRAERRQPGFAGFLDNLDLALKLAAAYPALSEDVQRLRVESVQLRAYAADNTRVAEAATKERNIALAKVQALEAALRAQAA